MISFLTEILDKQSRQEDQEDQMVRIPWLTKDNGRNGILLLKIGGINDSLLDGCSHVSIPYLHQYH